MKTFTYLGASTEGGTYRVFETLRDGLAAKGWKGHFVNEASLGPSPCGLSGANLAVRMCDHLAGYGTVIGNVFIRPI